MILRFEEAQFLHEGAFPMILIHLYLTLRNKFIRENIKYFFKFHFIFRKQYDSTSLTTEDTRCWQTVNFIKMSCHIIHQYSYVAWFITFFPT